MKKTKQLILFGDSAFAEVAYCYFQEQSEFEVVGFTVSRDFKQRNTLFGLPIVDFETVEKQFPPGKHQMFIALVYNEMNKIRKDFYQSALGKGYTLASFVSPYAQVWKNVTLGNNTFIFENNVVQPFARIGSNTILWSGNHIGHHSQVGDHNFLASQVVVSGFVTIEESCFIGVNATLVNNITIGSNSFIGAGALVTSSLPAGSVVKGNSSTPKKREAA